MRSLRKCSLQDACPFGMACGLRKDTEAQGLMGEMRCRHCMRPCPTCAPPQSAPHPPDSPPRKPPQPPAPHPTPRPGRHSPQIAPRENRRSHQPHIQRPGLGGIAPEQRQRPAFQRAIPEQQQVNQCCIFVNKGERCFQTRKSFGTEKSDDQARSAFAGFCLECQVATRPQ